MMRNIKAKDECPTEGGKEQREEGEGEEDKDEENDGE